MTLRYLLRTRVVMIAVAVVLVLASAGCGTAPTVPPTGGDAVTPEECPASSGPRVPAAPLKVKEAAKINLPPGPLVYLDHTLSPDGRWAVILSTQGGKKAELWLYPVDEGEGRLVASINEKDYQAGSLLLRSLGWTQDNELVFTRQGTQPEGIHKG